MDFKFTIGRRIGIGFAIFIIGTMVAFILTIITLNDSKTRTETVVSQITPSVADLKEINLLLQRSHTDISKWYFNKSFNDVEFRAELERIIKKDYPTKKEHLKELSKIWTPEDKQSLSIIFNQIEALFVKNIIKRSIPIPKPEVGGIPYSKARKKSSSIIPLASSSPFSAKAICASKRSLWSIGSFNSE